MATYLPMDLARTTFSCTSKLVSSRWMLWVKWKKNLTPAISLKKKKKIHSSIQLIKQATKSSHKRNYGLGSDVMAKCLLCGVMCKLVNVNFKALVV